jgi:hypothetical protein
VYYVPLVRQYVLNVPLERWSLLDSSATACRLRERRTQCLRWRAKSMGIRKCYARHESYGWCLVQPTT